MPIIEGLFIGLGMILFIGPVFFTLLQTSLKQGFMAGFMIDFIFGFSIPQESRQ